MQHFHKLRLWVKAHLLAMDLYRLSEGFPRRDGAALTTKLRRATLSVLANIAEGAGKLGHAESRRSLDIALGSAAESHYQLLVARDRPARNCEVRRTANRITKVRHMLAGLIRRVKLAKAEQVPLFGPKVPSR